MKTTDSPGAMLVMPLSATAAAKEPELSSIFQPVMSIVWVVLLVSSNQSAMPGLLPLAQGATSDTNRRPTEPGEPISVWGVGVAGVTANPPFCPTALSWDTVPLLMPAA